MKVKDYLSKSIKWNATGDAENPYTATLEGKSVSIRLNDFPADNLYTLIVGETEVAFDDWPSTWTKTNKTADKKAPKSNGFPRGRLVKVI